MAEYENSGNNDLPAQFLAQLEGVDQRAVPTVGVGMPVYNGEQFLEAALQSHLEQTFDDFELLICDNASTDRTAEIARDYEAKDDRIRYLRSERNLGGNPNFNRAFRFSRGRYFRWAACDDTIAPEYLARTVALLEGDPAAVLAHTQSGAIDRYGKPMMELANGFVDPDGTIEHFTLKSSSGRWLTNDSPSQRMRAIVHTGHKMSYIFGLMRRDALMGTLLHRPFYGTDRVLLAEMALQGTFLIDPEPLFFRRCHDANSSREGTDTSLKDQWDAADKTYPARIMVGYLNAVAEADLGMSERLRAYAVVAAKLATPKRLVLGR